MAPGHEIAGIVTAVGSEVTAFKVGDRAEWSYLLPSRLPRGRYVLDTYALDNAFNRSTTTRVRFRVR